MIPRPPAWTASAACIGQASRDRDPWHPAQENYAEARRVCEGCPVRGECLEEAFRLLEVSQVHGMWAGLTPRELRKQARAQGRATRRVAQHGTRARYVGHKCRCPECRHANARDEHERRETLDTQSDTPPPQRAGRL